MPLPIRVLHLEDNPLDAELIAEGLKDDGRSYHFVLATGKGSFESAATAEHFDVVLCDYNIPGYDGMTAIQFVRSIRPDTPIIILSGALGDEGAVECLKAGATDYVLKHNLPRLGNVISRALAEAEERRKREAVERRYADLFEFSSDALLITDREGLIVQANRQITCVFGWTPEELVGQPVEILLPIELRSGHRELRESYQQSALPRAMGSRPGDLFGVRKDGSVFPVDVGLSPIETDEGLLVLTAIADITERKRREVEQRKLNEELERRVEERTSELAGTVETLRQRNEELGQFATVASHDLQTPLRGIVNFAQFLAAEYSGKLDETADDYLNRIIKGASRMQQLISDLLAYSRVESQTAQFQPVDLNEVFEDALQLLHALVEESGAEVTCDTLPVVSGDYAQLSQLMQNLIDNSIKYRSEQPPRVHISAVDSGEDCWTISIQDNGIGIAEEHYGRVFEIFRRLHTQQAFPGTGIGLAVCRRIAHRHGGRLEITSKVGEGSTFHLTIPTL